MNSNEIRQALTRNRRLRRSARPAALVFLLVVGVCPRSRAQDAHTQKQNSYWPAPSGLAADNLSNVAASATEIEAILRKDRGLFIELKRWVAKDGADHGQIVRDAELDDGAIYLRLESDVKFRSIATALLQRYGYLLPQVNPDSSLGRQQELLLQERAKWLAQRQELERQRIAERNARPLLCDPQHAAACGDRSPLSQEKDGTEVKASDAPEEPDLQDMEDPQNAPLTVPNPGTPLPQSPRGGSPLVQTSEVTGIGPSPSSPLLQSPGSLQSLGDISAYSPDRRPGGMQEAMGAGVPFSDVAALGGRLPSDMGALEKATELRPGAEAPDLAALADDKGSLSRDRVWRKTKRKNVSLGTPMIREPQPYGDIPSLYDMYWQVAPRPPKPERFGLDVFDRPSRFSQKLPMDLPVGPEYVVGPGDGLAVDFWGGVSRRLIRTVDPEGRLSLPEVGPVLVSGKTLGDVQDTLQKVLRTQFRELSVAVSLARLRTVRVYVVGDVDRPGAYDISSLSTPLNALFAAGGPTARGSLRTVKHLRGDQLVEEVDVYSLLLYGMKTNLRRLENGDTVLVPPLEKQVTVEGMVRRPAIYELRNEKNLAEVLELAGGILPGAALGHIEVQRTVAHDRRTMLSLDIPQAQDAAAIIKQLESFAIQDGDAVNLFPIAPYNQDAVFLDGYVLRPGRYAYRPGMRLTDVVSSYKDLLPEPATGYAEIIRLNAPDFSPSVEGFNLAEALSNPSASPELKPLDTVRIFSRFDFEDPPVVSVLGDVRRPGTYRATGQLHVRDAILLAGGLRPDAQLAEAQVFSHLPDSTLRVTSLNLQEAISGNPQENILLRPRDAILIHSNPAKLDPPSVYIEGEVLRPGRYPLTADMRVADLIRLGGGLKRGADTVTADLTLYAIGSAGNGTISAGHRQIRLASAMTGEADQNVPLRDGDTLTIRQVQGWSDLGVSVLLRGEVKYPGSYGLQPGERLSSVLKRAGGFSPEAYPYGAVLQRTVVRELEERSQNELLQRVQASQAELKLAVDQEGDPGRKRTKEAAYRQWESTMASLEQTRPLGRMTIRISSDIRHWQNTPADIELRAGDVLTIPKRPSHVMVSGQVYHPTAVGYQPGKSAKWYLTQSGGPTTLANKRAMFVVCADGSVIGGSSGSWGGSSFDRVLQPGDMVVVPEKAIGGARVDWQLVLSAANLASAVAYTTILATR